VFAATGARAVVVDRAAAMARAAVGRGVAALVGDGRALPLGDGVADLVYFHVSLHYGGWKGMLSEAARVAKPGGMVAAWTFAPDHFRHSLLARWFPSIVPLDEARFPLPDLVEARLWALGLSEVHQVAETETVSREVGDWEAAVQAGFVSTLQLLPPGELQSGLARLREEHPDPAEVLLYRLWYRGIMGRKTRG
jgi:SAM-dependent methyltransferase